MGGKKAYRRLMQRYCMTFNFREPYQVLLDAEILQDAARFKMDMVAMLERTLQGKVKPMVTQCTMRDLYNADPPNQPLISLVKSYERRRCNHHTLEKPLTTLECFSSVVDPKGSGTNKHRYVIASQDTRVRAKMRSILGVPLIYIHRSVMIMEPMAETSELQREYDERRKFRAGLKSRERGNHGAAITDTTEMDGETTQNSSTSNPTNQLRQVKSAGKKRRRGPREPNPLSVKKSKKTHQKQGQAAQKVPP
jgi:U3 small nucleolar RNA-associated protein 23